MHVSSKLPYLLRFRRVPRSERRRGFTFRWNEYPRGAARYVTRADEQIRDSVIRGRTRKELFGLVLGDLEGGLLLAPPDFPLVGGGPPLPGDVLEGLDDGLLDVVETGRAGGLVALLTLVVAIGAGLLVLDPLLHVLLQLDQGVHGFLRPNRAGGADGRLRDAGVGLAELAVHGRDRRRVLQFADGLEDGFLDKPVLLVGLESGGEARSHDLLPVAEIRQGRGGLHPAFGRVLAQERKHPLEC